jgi:glycosyltransferase involved in cell wall biosynthesis
MQTVEVANIVVSEDIQRRGAALNRDDGLNQVDTEWTAFLDDDDELYSNHLHDLLKHARQTGADLVYPWFDVIGGTDPFPMFEGLPWDNENTHQFPITFLVKTEAAKAVGGFSGDWIDNDDVDAMGNRAGEDWNFIQKFYGAGYKISHLNQRTWAWHHHGLNTSGLPSRW